MDIKEINRVFSDFVCRESVDNVLQWMNYVEPTTIFIAISRSNLAKNQRIIRKIGKIMEYNDEHLQQTYKWCLSSEDRDNNRTNPVLHIGLGVLCKHGLLTVDLLNQVHLDTYPDPVVEKIFSDPSPNNKIFDYLVEHPKLLVTERCVHLSFHLELDDDQKEILFAKYRQWRASSYYWNLY